MPRLPRIGSGQVQSLGRRDPNQAAREASQNIAIIGSAVGLATGVVNKMERDKAEAQEREAGLAMSRAMVRFEEQYGGRDMFTPDELPSGVEVRRTEKVVGDDGELVEVDRTAIPAYEVYPQLYRTFASNFAESAASGIDSDEQRSVWMANAEQNINATYVQRLQGSRAEQERFLASQLSADITVALDSNQYAVADELASGIKDPEQRARVKKSIAKTEEIDYYDQLVVSAPNNADSIEEIDNALADLRSSEYEGSLTEAERIGKANALENAKLLANAEVAARDERIRQEHVSDVWMGIGRGDPRIDESYVQDLFDNEDIDGPERTRMLKALEKQRASAVDNTVTRATLDRIAAAGYGIDPKDTALRRAVDARFEEYVASHDGDVVAAGTQIMQEFRVVPKQLISMFRAGNRADAPNLAQSAQLMIYAQDHAPESLADFKEGEVTYIEKVASNMKLGMDMASAVEAVRNYDALSPTQRESLRRAASTMTATNLETLQDFVSDQPSYDIPWSISDPEVPVFMAAEFDALVERILPQMGFNTEAAQRQAFTALTKKWSMTDVNGDHQLMKYAPKAPAEQIRAQIRAEYSGKLGDLTSMSSKKFTPKDVRIASDSLTEIQIRNGQKPTYRAFVVVDEENQVFEELERFQWDSNKATSEMKKQTIQAAKDKRARMEQATAELLDKQMVGL